MTRFLTIGADLNILRSVKGSIRSVSSGVASYWRFCQLLARPSFPPTEDTALLWSATFRAVKTYNQYLARLQKASTLLRYPLDWLTPSVRCVGKGLKNAQDLPFKPPNFIGPEALLRWAKLDSATGQAYYLSFLFSLRVPSETLRLQRAFADDRLAEFIPQDDKALIGARRYKGAEVLVVKFAPRKNI